MKPIRPLDSPTFYLHIYNSIVYIVQSNMRQVLKLETYIYYEPQITERSC